MKIYVYIHIYLSIYWEFKLIHNLLLDNHDINIFNYKSPVFIYKYICNYVHIFNEHKYLKKKSKYFVTGKYLWLIQQTLHVVTNFRFGYYL